MVLQDAEMLLQLGAALSRMRQPGQSERCFSAAAKAAPGEARSWHGLAQAQSRQGRLHAKALKPSLSSNMASVESMSCLGPGMTFLAFVSLMGSLCRIGVYLCERTC